MKKEYIMSEDDKREKRKKIEQNRAIKKRTVEDVCESSNESIPKHMKIDKEEEEQQKDKKPTTPVKVNLLNMASTSSKTYQKKQLKYNSSEEQLAPFPSPGVPEPSSPGSSVVTESRTCNVFNQHRFDSNRSRPVEIYQLSKPQEVRSTVTEDYEKDCPDSSIIKTILNTEISKSNQPSNSNSSYQEEDRFNHFYRNELQSDSEYLLSQSEILELTKNNKNVILKTTKEGSKIIVITENPEEQKDDSRSRREEGSTPLLTSLINTNNPPEGESKDLTFRTDLAEEVLQDIPRYFFFF